MYDLCSLDNASSAEYDIVTECHYAMQIWNLPQVQWFAIAPHVANRTQYYFKEMGLNKTVHWCDVVLVARWLCVAQISSELV